MKSRFVLAACGMLSVSLVGCSGGGNDSSGGGDVPDPVATTLEILSPTDNASVPYNSVSVSVDANNIQSVSVSNAAMPDDGAYEGVKNADRFLVHGIALAPGQNQLNVSAIDTGGVDVDETVTVTSSREANAVGLSATRSRGYGSLTTTIKVQSAVAAVSSFSYDFDGDGVLDSTVATPEAETTYSVEGTFSPLVMIETGDGLLYSRQATGLVAIRPMPIASAVDALSGVSVVDLHTYGNATVFILSSDNVVRQVNVSDDSIEREIPLAGPSDPSGLCMDDSRNLYVTDSGVNRVFKFLASSAYRPDTLISPDGSFGGTGSADGQFAQPSDCMVDSTRDDEKIFIVDKGNNRVQVFNRAGIYLSQFDGDGTSTGRFNSPGGILGTARVPIIADTGNDMVRIFGQNGVERRNFGVGMLSGPTRITASNNGLIVADSGNNRVLLATTFGAVLDELQLAGAPAVAINTQGSTDVFYVVSAGQSGTMKHESMLDPSDSSPQAIVQRFVDAIIAGDRRTVADLSSDDGLVELIYADPQSLTQLIDLLSSMSSVNVEAIDSVFAGVTIAFAGESETLPITLIRFNDTWRVRRF